MRTVNHGNDQGPIQVRGIIWRIGCPRWLPTDERAGDTLGIGYNVAMPNVSMEFKFESKIIFWRGPAPYFFAPVPAKQSREIKTISKLVTYGWGAIPVQVQLGQSQWKTSLFPKDGGYLVPIKAVVQKAEDINEGDTVTLRLDIGR